MIGDHTIGIVVARMNSKRLPGKALRMIGGRPLIGWAIGRARRCRGLAKVVVATTDHSEDDPIVEYAGSVGVDVYRGACEDVACRVLNCAEHYRAERFVRLNGDSPFLDPELVDRGISLCDPGVEFVTNLIGRTFPYGIAVEVMRTSFYHRYYAQMVTDEDREHVTRAIYTGLSQVCFRQFQSQRPTLARARLVVDTESDEKMVQELVRNLGGDAETAGYERVATLWIGANPEASGR